MKVAAIYVALAVLITISLGFFGSARDIWALKSRAATATGAIVGVTCEDHSTVRYKFVAAGSSYVASGHHGKKSCPMVTVGEQVTVYYLPETPGTSTLEEPRLQWHNEVVSIGGAALLMPAFIVWAYRRRYRDAA